MPHKTKLKRDLIHPGFKVQLALKDKERVGLEQDIYTEREVIQRILSTQP